MTPPPPRSTLFPYTTLFRSFEETLTAAGTVILKFFLNISRDEQRKRLQERDRKSTRLNSSHVSISYAVFCLKKKKGTRATRSRSSENRSTSRGWFPVRSWCR